MMRKGLDVSNVVDSSWSPVSGRTRERWGLENEMKMVEGRVKNLQLYRLC